MPPSSQALELIGRRHPEWREHHLRWRWMLDSLEGGERYRQAVYGYDSRGLPVRNLVRHKREYPDPRDIFDPAMGLSNSLMTPTGLRNELSSDPAYLASDDDY